MKPPRVVVMGGSGCGKSTVGRQLALSLDLPYLEGDDLHLPENVACMHGGMPLSLLDSQFATLEPPGTDEGAWSFDVSMAPEEIVASVAKTLAGVTGPDR